MPTAQQNPKAINAARFASLMAGMDSTNPCEAEAVNKFRALRRMVVEAGLRIVDVLEMPEVRQAIDDQMQPARQKNGDLQDALEQVAELREELTERTRNVRELAELLKQQEETANALREDLAAAKYAAAEARTHQQQRQAGNAAAAPACVVGSTRHSFGAQSWLFEVGAVVVLLIVIVMSVFHSQPVQDQSENHKQGQRIVAAQGSAAASGRHIGGKRKNKDMQKARAWRGADADGHVRIK